MKDRIVTSLWIMPLMGPEIDLKSLYSLFKTLNPTHVFLEQVHAIFGASAKSTFKFGQVYGMTEAIISSLDIPYTLVQPKIWQAVGHTGLDRKMKAKDRSALAANKRYPSVDFRASDRAKKSHDGLIDATLIAEYGSTVFKVK